MYSRHSDSHSRGEGSSGGDGQHHHRRPLSPQHFQAKTPLSRSRPRGPSVRSASPNRRPAPPREPQSPTRRPHTPPTRVMPWDGVASYSKAVEFEMDIDDLSVQASGRYPTGVPLAFSCE